jgi:metal-dependent amidase/aminoacylase/carboxypeptidase family protein
VDLHIDVGYPCVMNNEKVTAMAMSKAAEYLGSENVSETELRMGAEDFGYYAQQIPACFYRLGTMNKAKGITAGVHTPVFNIDEHAIEIGMGMMAWLGSRVEV